MIEFTVTPSCLYSTFAVYTVSRLCKNISFLEAPANEFASVAASISVKCYKTAEGYEDTLHISTVHIHITVVHMDH